MTDNYMNEGAIVVVVLVQTVEIVWLMTGDVRLSG